MKLRLLMVCAVVLLAVGIAYAAMEDIKNIPSCSLCGMNRDTYASSRMLIQYADGATVGVCSLHCAINELRQHKDKQVTSIKVADFNSKELIDAKSAVWVLGGKLPGVMSPAGKWAFAGDAQARAFVKDNGGSVVDFVQVMDTSEASGTAMEHAGHNMGLGAQMLFNPAFGDQIYHTHPAGMWMVNYKFMRMSTKGYLDGSSSVRANDIGYTDTSSSSSDTGGSMSSMSVKSAAMGGDMGGGDTGSMDSGSMDSGSPKPKKYNYMMIPTSMTMDMHMVMAMYGVTDRVTLMGMTGYVYNKMNMLMDMGMGSSKSAPMSTGGLGDTELRAMYKINDLLVGSLGLSLPTGSIKETIDSMGDEYRAPYDMQLGSGTYDLKPAITYTDLSADGLWNWGTQLQYTAHTGHNGADYTLGDNFKATGWVQRAFGPATAWGRLAYNDTDHIHGHDEAIDETQAWSPMPDGDPHNYGGQKLDGMLGVSFTKGPFSFGVEAGMPIYQHLYGLQLKNDWSVNFAFQTMF